MIPVAIVALLAAPDLAAVDLAAALQTAEKRLHAALGEDVVVPKVKVRWRDAGEDRSGTRAWSRTDGDAFLIELAREYAALGALDIETTLTHELFHIVHRHALGEKKYARVPGWAREGAAVFVAGQGAERARLLTVHVMRENGSDPLARLVDGLEGAHEFLDYYEDAAAFEAAGKKAKTLIRALLKEPDPKRAVRSVLKISFAEFERRGQARARKVLAVHIAALRRGPSPAYPDSYLPRVRVLRKAGKPKEAVALLRKRVLKNPKKLLAVGEAAMLELELRKQLKDPTFPAALKRARKNLRPFDLDWTALDPR